MMMQIRDDVSEFNFNLQTMAPIEKLPTMSMSNDKTYESCDLGDIKSANEAKKTLDLVTLQQDYDTIKTFNLVKDLDLLDELYLQQLTFENKDYLTNLLVSKYRERYSDLFDKYSSLETYVQFCVSTLLFRKDVGLREMTSQKVSIPSPRTQAFFKKLLFKRKNDSLGNNDGDMKQQKLNEEKLNNHPFLNLTFYKSHQLAFNVGSCTQFCQPSEFAVLFCDINKEPINKLVHAGKSVKYIGLKITFKTSIVTRLYVCEIQKFNYIKLTRLGLFTELLKAMTNHSCHQDSLEMGKKKIMSVESIAKRSKLAYDSNDKFESDVTVAIIDGINCFATIATSLVGKTYSDVLYRIENEMIDLNPDIIQNCRAKSDELNAELYKFYNKYKESSNDANPNDIDSQNEASTSVADTSKFKMDPQKMATIEALPMSISSGGQNVESDKAYQICDLDDIKSADQALETLDLVTLRQDYDKIKTFNLVDDLVLLDELYLWQPTFENRDYLTNLLVSQYRERYSDLFVKYSSLETYVLFCVSTLLYRKDGDLRSMTSPCAPKAGTQAVFTNRMRKRKNDSSENNDRDMKQQKLNEEKLNNHPFLNLTFYKSHELAFNVGNCTKICQPSEFAVLFCDIPKAPISEIAQAKKFTGLKITFKTPIVTRLYVSEVHKNNYIHISGLGLFTELLETMTNHSCNQNSFEMGRTQTMAVESIARRWKLAHNSKDKFESGATIAIIGSINCFSTVAKILVGRTYGDVLYRIENEIIDLNPYIIENCTAINEAKSDELNAELDKFYNKYNETSNDADPKDIDPYNEEVLKTE